jgi:hypothetical protein
MTVNERIDALREEMKKEGIDFYLIPMADYHHQNTLAIILKAWNIFPDLREPMQPL